MSDEKKAVDEFLQGLNKGAENPFKSKDPFEIQEDTGAEGDEGADDKGKDGENEEEDKPIPFHKDPKVQRYVEKEIAKALKNVPAPAAKEDRNNREEDEVTGVLERIIGNDTPEKVQAVKDFRKVLGSLEEKGAQRALDQFKEQAREASQKDTEALESLYEGLEEVEDTYDVDLSSNTAVARKLRSDFVAYIRKIAPKDDNGEVAAFPDIPSAFEEFQEKLKKPSANRAKELASRSMSRSNDANVAPTNTDKSWKGVEKLFNKLTS